MLKGTEKAWFDFGVGGGIAAGLFGSHFIPPALLMSVAAGVLITALVVFCVRLYRLKGDKTDG